MRVEEFLINSLPFNSLIRYSYGIKEVFVLISSFFIMTGYRNERAYRIPYELAFVSCWLWLAILRLRYFTCGASLFPFRRKSDQHSFLRCIDSTCLLWSSVKANELFLVEILLVYLSYFQRLISYRNWHWHWHDIAWFGLRAKNGSHRV